MNSSQPSKIQSKQDAIFKKMSPAQRIRAMGEFSEFIKKLGHLRKQNDSV